MILPALLKNRNQPSTKDDAPQNSDPQLALSGVDNPLWGNSFAPRSPISKRRAKWAIANTHLMRGFVPTPSDIVDRMVARLFRGRHPKSTDILLDPGCGNGAFLRGVLRWCARHAAPRSKMVGIESDADRAQRARADYGLLTQVEIRNADFLSSPDESFDFIIGNPPYIAIYGFSDEEKRGYRAKYQTARGRFDSYLLFFERALKSLKPGARMAFITPEKFLYVETAAPLRQLLSGVDIEEIELANEETFAGLVTYPAITTIVRESPHRLTAVRLRDGTLQRCKLDGSGSWMPIIRGVGERPTHRLTLQDICVRVSCGVATGADDVFVRNSDSLEPELVKYARATIAGRELTSPGEILNHSQVMLIPYDRQGALIPEQHLGALRRYLLSKQQRLIQRTCVQRKPWYSFHETPPMRVF